MSKRKCTFCTRKTAGSLFQLRPKVVKNLQPVRQRIEIALAERFLVLVRGEERFFSVAAVLSRTDKGRVPAVVLAATRSRNPIAL